MMVSILDLDLEVPPSCGCSECIDMCKRCPCIPTPQQAWSLMQLPRIGKRLGRQIWEIPNHDHGKYRWHTVSAIGPVTVGHEGAPDGSMWGQCSLLTPKGRCPLHKTGLKPVEAVLAHHDEHFHVPRLHSMMIELWDKELGRLIVRRWREQQ